MTKYEVTISHNGDPYGGIPSPRDVKEAVILKAWTIIGDQTYRTEQRVRFATGDLSEEEVGKLKRILWSLFNSARVTIEESQPQPNRGRRTRRG